jgi:hypothetical protein
MITKTQEGRISLRSERMKARQERFLVAFANCGRIVEACRRAGVGRDAHYSWQRSDPTYPERFKEAVAKTIAVLEDKAMELAVAGVSRPELHNGRPVYIGGSKLYRREYNSQMIRFLLTAMNREKYGDRKVIELNFKDWDGDISKLSEGAIRGIIEILRKQAALEEAEAAQRNAIPAMAERVHDTEETE